MFRRWGRGLLPCLVACGAGAPPSSPAPVASEGSVSLVSRAAPAPAPPAERVALVASRCAEEDAATRAKVDEAVRQMRARVDEEQARHRAEATRPCAPGAADADDEGGLTGGVAGGVPGGARDPGYAWKTRTAMLTAHAADTMLTVKELDASARHLLLPGQLLAARLVDGVLHVATQRPSAAPFEPKAAPSGLRWCGMPKKELAGSSLPFLMLAEYNAAEMRRSAYDSSVVAEGSATTPLCDVLSDPSGPRSTWVALISFDLGDVRATAGGTVLHLGQASAFFGARAVYVAVRGEQTAVHTFALGKRVAYRRSDVVPGTATHRGDFSEHDGVVELRTSAGVQTLAAP